MSNTAPTPGTTTPGTFLGREPLLWANAVRAVLLLLIGLGVMSLDEVEIALVLAANEAILYLITRTQATPNVSVVERRMGTTDVVVAGPANEHVGEGQVIRRIGDPPPAEVEPMVFTSPQAVTFAAPFAVSEDGAYDTPPPGWEDQKGEEE